MLSFAAMPQEHMTMSPRAKPDCNWDAVWAAGVTDALNTIDAKLNHILNDLHGNLPIIPELERQIKRSMRFVHAIDLKVKDQPKK